ncbi:MAG TPA: hypothetical protein VEX15_02280 [Nocardioidaceae bacterium]|nr:hypothetical protein [Nocardioidaceae bacterium]
MRWPVLAMFAALPLQWFVVGNTPLGIGRLHQLALLAFAAAVLARYRVRAHGPVLRIAMPFIAANVCILLIWLATSIFHGEQPFGPVQQAIYLGVFVAVGTVIYRAACGTEPRLLEALRWTAAAAGASVILGLTYSMLANGVNPAQVFSQTIATANPELLQKEVFRSAFTGFGFDEETVRGNIRHEVFGAVLASMYVAAWASRLRPFTRSGPRFLFHASLVVCTLLLLVSMSRSILVAALAWPLIGFLRSAVTFRLSGRQVVLAYTAVATFMLALASGFASVLWVRFTEDTSSYEAREGLYDLAYNNIADHFFTGGVETAGESSHNFVLDTWLRTGVFGALAALVVLLVLIGLWASLIVRIGTEPAWMVPVTAAMALPVVRLLTAGGGLIPPIEWVLLGFVAGAMAYRQTLAAAPPAPEVDERSDAKAAHG